MMSVSTVRVPCVHPGSGSARTLVMMLGRTTTTGAGATMRLSCCSSTISPMALVNTYVLDHPKWRARWRPSSFMAFRSASTASPPLADFFLTSLTRRSSASMSRRAVRGFSRISSFRRPPSASPRIAATNQLAACTLRDVHAIATSSRVWATTPTACPPAGAAPPPASSTDGALSCPRPPCPVDGVRIPAVPPAAPPAFPSSRVRPTTPAACPQAGDARALPSR
ncbi:hypothetical protein U9M48_037822 [Paspalum notatum var. saurae]|uniref:Uncharacterized protein n=1 Tax=Paspalum notatum var. saurae TaxID=547442 RepID=A0AAQ3UFS1_PASNO